MIRQQSTFAARLALACVGIAALATAACGPATTFGLSQDDNDPALLAAAFAAERGVNADAPFNQTANPMAFLVTAAKPRELIAWDLNAGKALWRVQANVTSRVVVGASFVAAKEGDDKLVAHSLADGKVLWSVSLPAKATFLGAAADGDKLFYTVQDNSKAKRAWFLVAVAGGTELWRAEAPGALGAPAARGGLVYMPFLTQWLSILDANTGKLLARLRQSDEAVNWIRTTSRGVYYGSRGVIALDDKAVAGTKKGVSYLAAQVPTEFAKSGYWFDAFNAVQAGYSAFDRNRILWFRAGADGFLDDQVIAFSYRFFFAMDAKTGELRWAHQHPRTDVVAAEHAGSSIVYVSAEGEIGALDAKTGAARGQVKVGARIWGATFDAEGYAPKGQGEAPDTVTALVSIVGNKDTRFTAMKQFAVSALGRVPGEAASRALLGVVLDPNTPPALATRAGETLVGRKDASTLPAILEALGVHANYLSGAQPRALGVLVRGAGALADGSAVPALTAHLVDPATPALVIKDVAEALVACGGKAALPELRSFLLLHRGDPALDTTTFASVMHALLALGGAAERQLIGFIASDPRSTGDAAEAAKAALAPSDYKRKDAAAPADKPE